VSELGKVDRGVIGKICKNRIPFPVPNLPWSTFLPVLPFLLHDRGPYPLEDHRIIPFLSRLLPDIILDQALQVIGDDASLEMGFNSLEYFNGGR